MNTKLTVDYLPKGTRFYAKNICFWHDGTARPIKGCDGTCKWIYDGQVFVHKRKDKL
jgi:hypothetical protein